MFKSHPIFKLILLAAVSLSLVECTPKTEKYADVIQFAEDFIQIPYDSEGNYHKTFYAFMDPSLPLEKTTAWLNQQFIDWGKDPRTAIELDDISLKRDKEVKLFTLKFTVTRASEHRYFDYIIGIKQLGEVRSIIEFNAIEHQISTK